MSATTATTTPQETVERFLALLGSDLDAAMGLLAERVVYENRGTFPLPTWRSRTSSHRFLKAFIAPFGGFGAEIHKIAADGDLVMTERTDWLLIGQTRCPFWVCGWFEVRDGQIVHWRDSFDTGDMLLGLVGGGATAALRALTPGRRA